MSNRTKWMLIVGGFVALAFLPYAFKSDRGPCVKTGEVETVEMYSMVDGIPLMQTVKRKGCLRWVLTPDTGP